jgi:hypothetical protein
VAVSVRTGCAATTSGGVLNRTPAKPTDQWNHACCDSEVAARDPPAPVTPPAAVSPGRAPRR